MSWMSLLSIMIHNNLQSILFLSYLFATVTLCSSLNPRFEACQSIICGYLIISYPFYIEGRQRSFCGFPGFGLSCSDNDLPIFNISDTQYNVNEISYSNQSIRASEAASSSSNGTSCAVPRTHHNITLDGTSFSFAPNQTDLFLVFGCYLGSLPADLWKYRVGCFTENETMSVLAIKEEEESGDLRSASEKCNGGVVKTKVENNNTGVNGEIVRRGFVLNWMVAPCSLCEETGGKCGFDSNPSAYSFKCYCPDRDHAVKCDLPLPG